MVSIPGALRKNVNCISVHRKSGASIFLALLFLGLGLCSSFAAEPTLHSVILRWYDANELCRGGVGNEQETWAWCVVRESPKDNLLTELTALPTSKNTPQLANVSTTQQSGESDVAPGKWVGKIHIDPLTDEPGYSIGTIADSGEGTLGLPPFLMVKCKATIIYVEFKVGIIGIGDYVSLQYRFDEAPAQELSAEIFQDSLIISGQSAKEFIRRLRNSAKLYFRVRLPIEKTVDGVFRLQGADAEFQKFQSKCDW